MPIKDFLIFITLFITGTIVTHSVSLHQTILLKGVGY